MKHKWTRLLLIGTMMASLTLSACGGGGDNEKNEATIGLPSASTVAKASIVPAGTTCPSGGVQLESGIDKNRNGVLDPDEVSNIDFICHGNDGLSILVIITDEGAGINCQSGGQKIETGIDFNLNRVLDPSEVDKVSYVCNGVGGQNGSNGTDGADGVDGQDGLTSLMTLTKEFPGDNCTYGGQKIEIGIDLNFDGFLALGEIQDTQYICNGADGSDGNVVSVMINMDEYASPYPVKVYSVYQPGRTYERQTLIRYSENETENSYESRLLYNVGFEETYFYTQEGQGEYWMGGSNRHFDPYLQSWAEPNGYTHIPPLQTWKYGYIYPGESWGGIYERVSDTGLSSSAWRDHSFVGYEDVTVPAGHFKDCLKIRRIRYTGSAPGISYYWYAKGYGLVKLDHFFSSSYQEYQELISVEDPGNLPPVASIGWGTTASIYLGEPAELSGDYSFDIDGDQITYLWSVISAPSGSLATIENSTFMNTQFVPDYVGEYIIQLVVNDGKEDSAPARTSFLVEPPIKDYSFLWDIEAIEDIVVASVQLMNSKILETPSLLDELYNNDFFEIGAEVQPLFQSDTFPDGVSSAKIKVGTLKYYYPYDVEPSQIPYFMNYIEYSVDNEIINSLHVGSLWGCSRDYSHPTARCVQYYIDTPGARMSGSVNLVPIEQDGLIYFEKKSTE